MAPSGRRFVVAGAGGHGRVVADLVRSLGHVVVGYADADTEKVGACVDAAGAAVILGQDALLACARGDARWPVPVDAIALGLGRNDARQKVARYVPERLLPALVHPTAYVSETATLGAGSVVLPRAVVHTDARVGAAVIVNSGAVIEHDCVLDAAVHVSPGAILCGGVTVGERSWIGAGAVIIPLRKIGCSSMVGAGAVVLRDVSDGATVVGNPASPLDAGRRPLPAPLPLAASAAPPGVE